MNEDIFYLWINKTIKTQITIWKIIRSFILNTEYFKKTNINEISKDFLICKKSLKKYLRSYFFKLKWRNEKRIYIKNKIEIQFYKDLEKIIKKYNWYVDLPTIKKGQYYLNNLR